MSPGKDLVSWTLDNPIVKESQQVSSDPFYRYPLSIEMANLANRLADLC